MVNFDPANNTEDYVHRIGSILYYILYFLLTFYYTFIYYTFMYTFILNIIYYKAARAAPEPRSGHPPARPFRAARVRAVRSRRAEKRRGLPLARGNLSPQEAKQQQIHNKHDKLIHNNFHPGGLKDKDLLGSSSRVPARSSRAKRAYPSDPPIFGRGDDTVGNPHRAQISQLELFELILLSKLDEQLPVERFEATVSHSISVVTGPSPPPLSLSPARATR